MNTRKNLALSFIMVIAGMFLYVAMKVDDIARALMSGGVVGGPGARLVSTAMLSGASGAGGAASKVAGKK